MGIGLMIRFKGKEELEIVQLLTNGRQLHHLHMVHLVNGYHIVVSLKIVNLKGKGHYICKEVKNL
jgi:hypothetical protein